MGRWVHFLELLGSHASAGLSSFLNTLTILLFLSQLHGTQLSLPPGQHCYLLAVFASCSIRFLIPVPMCVYGGGGDTGESSPYRREILWHQLGILRFNSTLTLSAWGWHQIPQAKGSVQDCPPLHANHKSRLLPVFLTNCL